MTPGILPSALWVGLRPLKIAPGDFVCPSCGARRMAETAALPADEIFPDVPLRQWVISFPFPLRFLGFVKTIFFLPLWQDTQLKPILAEAEATLLAVQREIERRR